jgi:ribose 5-phosphate isomerase A
MALIEGVNEAAKEAAGRAAAALVEDGMLVGLGTGTTAKHFVAALGERMRAEGLRLRGCVPTSGRAEALGRAAGLPLVPLTRENTPDLTVDGADEIDPVLHLIKGGGGALVREKLVAVSSREMVVIADATKLVPTLGAFPLPVAVFPFGWENTLARLEDAVGAPAALRPAPDGSGAPYVSDDGLHVIDLRLGAIPDPAGLQARLRAVTGVAEVGLFVGIARRALIGSDDGTVREVRPA